MGGKSIFVAGPSEYSIGFTPVEAFEDRESAEREKGEEWVIKEVPLHD